MIDRKWLLGVGASSMLALSALATPIAASAQENQNGPALPDNRTEVTDQNGIAPISEAEAIETALALVPGASVSDVHLDLGHSLGFGSPIFNLGAGATTEAGLIGGDQETHVVTNNLVNFVYNVELTNNIDVTIDASTGDIILIDQAEPEDAVDDEDAIEEGDNGVEDDDAIEEDDNGVEDEDAVEEDDNGVEDDDAIEEDDNGVEDEDAVEEDDNGVEGDDDAVDEGENGVEDDDAIEEGDNGVEDEDAVEEDDNGVEGDDDAVDEGENGAEADLEAAVTNTEAPTPQAQAFGHRAQQVCGDHGFAEFGFSNQGQCVSAAVALLQEEDKAPAEDETGVEDEDVVEEAGDDNGDNDEENGNG